MKKLALLIDLLLVLSLLLGCGAVRPSTAPRATTAPKATQAPAATAAPAASSAPDASTAAETTAPDDSASLEATVTDEVKKLTAFEIYDILSESSFSLFINSNKDAWLGTATDEERLKWADELIDIAKKLGADTGSITGADLVKAINEAYEAAVSGSIWDKACSVFGMDAKALTALYTGVHYFLTMTKNNFPYLIQASVNEWNASTAQKRMDLANNVIDMLKTMGFKIELDAAQLETAIGEYFKQNSGKSIFESACAALGLDYGKLLNFYMTYAADYNG